MTFSEIFIILVLFLCLMANPLLGSSARFNFADASRPNPYPLHFNDPNNPTNYELRQLPRSAMIGHGNEEYYYISAILNTGLYNRLNRPPWQQAKKLNNESVYMWVGLPNPQEPVVICEINPQEG